jgi:hypothetical protein
MYRAACATLQLLRFSASAQRRRSSSAVDAHEVSIGRAAGRADQSLGGRSAGGTVYGSYNAPREWLATIAVKY